MNDLLGKDLAEAVAVLNKIDDGLRLRVYSVDRIIPVGVLNSGFDPTRVNVRIKNDKVFEILGRF